MHSADSGRPALFHVRETRAAPEALEKAEKEWPRVGAIDPNYRDKGLRLEFTLEDPGVFTMPWSAGST